MNATKNKKCKKIRTWLHKFLDGRISTRSTWVHKHLVNCPRCRQRIAAVGRVNLALSALKAEPCSLDLLSRANTQTIGVLRHSLREEPAASKLKKALPEPGRFQKCAPYKHSLANLAACAAILVLVKIGVFSSMDAFQNDGQKLVKQYYASQAGQDIADDVFTA